MEALKNKRYITNKNGKATDVVLDLRTFEKIENELEEFYLIKEYDKAVKKTNEEFKKGKYITLDEYLKKKARKSK
jgi:hypothetical protein